MYLIFTHCVGDGMFTTKKIPVGTVFVEYAGKYVKDGYKTLKKRVNAEEGCFIFWVKHIDVNGTTHEQL